MLKTLADIAAILIALLTGAGVVAAFQQIAVLRRERQTDRDAAQQRIDIEDRRERERGGQAADGFALPVLTTTLQLQALCLFHLRLLENTEEPAGRFALRAVRAKVRKIIRELKAYKHALNILIGHFGMSLEVTSTLMRTHRCYHNISADLKEIVGYESTSEIYALAKSYLENTAKNFAILADGLAVDDDLRERIRRDEFHFMWLDQAGQIMKGFFTRGMDSYSEPRPFVPSLMVLNRKRQGA